MVYKVHYDFFKEQYIADVTAFSSFTKLNASVQLDSIIIIISDQPYTNYRG